MLLLISVDSARLIADAASELLMSEETVSELLDVLPLDDVEPCVALGLHDVKVDVIINATATINAMRPNICFLIIISSYK